MAVLQGGGQNLPSPCVCYPKDPMWNRVNQFLDSLFSLECHNFVENKPTAGCFYMGSWRLACNWNIHCKPLPVTGIFTASLFPTETKCSLQIFAIYFLSEISNPSWITFL